MAPKRVEAIEIEMLDIDLSGWDEPFRLPTIQTMPFLDQVRMRNGEMGGLIRYLADHCDDETLEAIGDLTRDEYLELSEAWGEASGVSLGKSKPSSSGTKKPQKASKPRSSSEG